MTKTKEQETIIINRSGRSTYPEEKSVSRSGATPPVAAVGADQSAFENQIVTLSDGGASYDPNSPALPLTYSWQQISGPTAVMFAGGGVAAELVQVPVIGGLGGIMTFQLTVTNSAGLSSSATTNVIIKAGANQAPIASIVYLPQYAEGSLVTLDASTSYDPDGDFLYFRWRQLSVPIVPFYLPNPAKLQFVAPVIGSPTTYTFQLSVSDTGLAAFTTVTFTTVPAHHPPVANAGPNQIVGFGSNVILNGTGSSDPDANPMTYAWTQTAGTPVTLDLTNPAQPKFVAPATQGTLTFSLVVSDQYLSSTASTVNVSAFPPGTIPNCANARANKTQLWPPNQTFSRVKIRGLEPDPDPSTIVPSSGGDDGEGSADADDPNEDTGSLSIVVNSITQDEPTSGTFPGDLSPDAIIQTTHANGQPRMRDLILLRRELSPSGDGRIYQINFTATDAISGASCSGEVQVCVPTKKGNGGMCVNSGQNYNSLQ